LKDVVEVVARMVVVKDVVEVVVLKTTTVPHPRPQFPSCELDGRGGGRPSPTEKANLRKT
jgi:hypothetical protein